MNHHENFREKYTNAGRIGGILVDRFYGAVKELLQSCGTGLNSVFEVGVGEGFSTQKIAAMLPAVTRFEASEYRSDLVPLAQQRNPDVRISRESIYELNREASSFDLVICLEVLEHLDNPRAGLDELARVCRKYAIVSVPREPVWRALNMLRGKYITAFGNTPGHLQHWSARAFRDFAESRFEVLAVRKPLPWTILLLKKKT